MIAEVKKYFIHQSEIYGKDFYLDLDMGLPVVTEQPGKPQTIEQFNSEIKDCQKDELSKSKPQLVFGSGPSDAKLMCICEAPGKDEDKQGKPFVGPAGELLIKILAAVKFSHDEVYIANIVKGGRAEDHDLEASEITECLPFLKKQIELIKPAVILVLGRIAAQSLFGVRECVVSLRAKENYINGIPVFVTHHPDELLGNPELKRETWNDVQKLRKVFDTIAN